MRVRKVREFHQARNYLHSLKLKNLKQWYKLCDKKQNPPDIPKFLYDYYCNHKDWKGLRDMLNTKRKYISYKQAERYIQKNTKVRTYDQFCVWRKTKNRPKSFPGAPAQIYKNNGWKNWGTFFGTGRKREGDFVSYEECKKFIKENNIKSESEWNEYRKNNKLPSYIPNTPRAVYRKDFKGSGDLFGTGYIPTRERVYLPFNEARKYVQNLNLKSAKEWSKYIKTNKLPKNIPAVPQNAYKEFRGMGDWLGTNVIAPQLRKYKSFDEAKIFFRKLKLKSEADWQHLCKSGMKPDDLPKDLYNHYSKHPKWKGSGDLLGNGNMQNQLRKYWSFKKARRYVRRLKLKTFKEWAIYCQSGVKPKEIPHQVYQVYKKEFRGMPDFLGSEKLNAIYSGTFDWAQLEEAKEFAQKIKAKSSIDYWNKTRKLKTKGKLPKNIPIHPEIVYR